MAEVQKKRKRVSEGGEKPRKKTTTSSDTNVLLLEADRSGFMPAIASTPGLQIPTGTVFQRYDNANGGKTEILLHSSTHPIIDYTAREIRDGSAEALYKHYIARIDPDANTIHLIEAPRMIMHRTVRSEDAEMREARVASKLQATSQSQRHELGKTFGTKKAKKAIASLAENAISIAHTDGSKKPLSKEEAAVMESMLDAAETVQTKEERQAAMDSGKPRPNGNFDAQKPEEVYTPDQVVGVDMLKMVRVKAWCDHLEVGKHIDDLTSRYVANRIKSLAGQERSDAVIKKLKTMKYMYHVIQFYHQLKPGRDGKKLPRAEALASAIDVEDNVLSGIKSRYSSVGVVNSFQEHKLIADLCACSLICDDAETDTYDLMRDLSLKPKAISTHFRECGVKLTIPSEVQMTRMGVKTKAEAAEHKIAKVKLPLQFPQARVIPKARRR